MTLLDKKIVHVVAQLVPLTAQSESHDVSDQILKWHVHKVTCCRLRAAQTSLPHICH